MEDTSKYWMLVRLKASGGYRIDELVVARTYFEQHFQLFVDSSLSDSNLQIELFQHYQAGDAKAALCLRCLISHAIWQECRSLARQFGNYYRFSDLDLLPYVLDDDGSLTFQGEYRSNACKILQKFNPRLAKLETWTARLVRQNSELNQFFNEQGLWLISDWAILNDTSISRLKRVLGEVYQLTSAEIEQSALILESYRAVYLPDHIAKGSYSRCADPTPEQCQRMADYFQAKSNQVVSSKAVFKKLEQIAKHLRQYRLSRHRPPTISIEKETTKKQVEAELIANTTDEQIQEREGLPQTIKQFLMTYQSQFLICLDTALEKTIEARLNRFKMESRAEQFLLALRLYYCDRLSMTKIALRIGLRAQDAVAKLLKLKELRLSVQLHMLEHLQKEVQKTAENYTTPDRLRAFKQQIEAVLAENVETLIREDAIQSYTVRENSQMTLFTARLCAYLDRR